MTTLYCPTCRTKHETQSNPPHAAIHISESEHLHPITREPV